MSGIQPSDGLSVILNKDRIITREELLAKPSDTKGNQIIMVLKPSSSGLHVVLNKAHIITRVESRAKPFDCKGEKIFGLRRDSLANYVFTNIFATLKNRNWSTSYRKTCEFLRYKYWSEEEEEDAGFSVCKEFPLELWGEIGKRLSSRLDILRFRSVCKTWRLSLPSPTRFPLLVPSLPETNNVPWVITEISTYYQCPWEMGFIVLEEVDQGGKFYAHRYYRKDRGVHKAKIGFPTRSFTYRWWSHRHTPYDRLTFISKAHHLRLVRPRRDDPTQLDYHYNIFALKMVIVSSSRDGVNPSYANQSDLSIVALLTTGAMEGRLALLRLKGSYESWAWDTDFCSTRLFLDVTIYRGRVCALDIQGCVVIVEFDDFGLVEMTQLSPPWPYACEMPSKYLYEDGGFLCLALHQVQWESYMLDLRTHKWVSIIPAPMLLIAKNAYQGPVRKYQVVY